MSQTTLIELIARAICKEEYGSENVGWDNQIPAARAVIAAIEAPGSGWRIVKDHQYDLD